MLSEEVTRRERPKSAPYLSLKNIQGTTIENNWKKIIFFPKKYLVKKSHKAEKPKKWSFRLIQRFLQTENFKKMQGVPFDEIRKVSEKVAECRKKTQRGEPLVSPVLLEALKKLWFSARIEPTLYGLVEDGR